MVDAPGSQLWHLPTGPVVDVFKDDGERSQIYSSGTSKGVRRRRFLVLMVDALGSAAPEGHVSRINFFSIMPMQVTTQLLDLEWGPKPPTGARPRGPPSMFFNIDGGRFRISISDTSSGGGALSTFFNDDGGRSWIYSFDTSQGGVIDVF
jgi:hypothetical protein